MSHSIPPPPQASEQHCSLRVSIPFARIAALPWSFERARLCLPMSAEESRLHAKRDWWETQSPADVSTRPKLGSPLVLLRYLATGFLRLSVARQLHVAEGKLPLEHGWLRPGASRLFLASRARALFSHSSIHINKIKASHASGRSRSHHTCHGFELRHKLAELTSNTRKVVLSHVR